MGALPRIPRPLSQRWQDVRIRFMPLVIFVVGGLLAAALWNRNWAPSGFVGEVRAPEATVLSPQAGRLKEVRVEAYAAVTNGQVLGVVHVVAPNTLKAQIAAARADLDVTRVRMALDQHRNNQNYEQLLVDLHNQRVDAAIARSNLRHAEDELRRSEALFRDGIVSETEYDLALSLRDALRVEVEERAQLIGSLEQSVERMKPTADAASEPVILEVVNDAVEAQQQALERTEGPVDLESPLDGIVTQVFRLPGENVIAGEPLFTVTAAPQHILGFIRQPISFDPQVGDTVEVRTRGQNRRRGQGQVLRVGSRLELFSQPLRIRGFDSSLERGLPVVISLPEGMRLRPGELVDLDLKERSAN